MLYPPINDGPYHSPQHRQRSIVLSTVDHGSTDEVLSIMGRSIFDLYFRSLPQCTGLIVDRAPSPGRPMTILVSPASPKENRRTLRQPNTGEDRAPRMPVRWHRSETRVGDKLRRVHSMDDNMAAISAVNEKIAVREGCIVVTFSDDSLYRKIIAMIV